MTEAESNPLISQEKVSEIFQATADRVLKNYMHSRRLEMKAEEINAEVRAKVEAILANGLIVEQVGRVPYYELDFSPFNGGKIFYRLD